eukprot:gene13311-33917_t
MATKGSARYAPLDIAGQVVLVTGASAGIGAATATIFAELGCKVVMLARRAEKLAELKAKIVAENEGAAIHCVTCDVADLAAVQALPDSLPEGFKQVVS